MPLSNELKSSEMDSAIQAFKSWRSNREKMCRIPEHLWQIAANLSTQYHYPLNTICKKLGLNWGDLKKKITQLSSNHPTFAQSQKSPCPNPFIELKLNNQEPSFLLNHPPHSPRCAVELTRPDGTVMKIFASDGERTPLNLMELCKTFLGDMRDMRDMRSHQ